MTRGLLALALLAAGLLAAAAPAAAQDVETARLVFERGLAAVDRGDEAEAERAFRASLELRWSVSAAFNLGELLLRSGEREEAREHFQRVVDQPSTPRTIRARARERLAALGPAPPEPTDRGGVDEVALGLALAVGFAATAAFAGVAAGFWVGANDTLAEAEACAGACPDDLLDRGREQVDLTNGFHAAWILAATVTAVSVVVVLATSGSEDDAVALRLQPGFASVTGAF